MKMIENCHCLKMYLMFKISVALGADIGSQEPPAVHYQNPQYSVTVYSLDLKVNIDELYFIFGNIQKCFLYFFLLLRFFFFF